MKIRAIVGGAVVVVAGCSGEAPPSAGAAATVSSGTSIALPPATTAAAVAPAPSPTQVPTVADSLPLPAHAIVDDSPLPPKKGRRVEIRVAAMPSKEDCARLVERYRSRGTPDGQVSVSIRVKAKGEESDLPVCVENFDGEGVQPGTAGAMLKALPGAVILPLPGR